MSFMESFRAQPVGVILDRREAVTAALQAEGVEIKRKLNLEETLTMSAIAHIIAPNDTDTFYPYQVARLAELPTGTVDPMLLRFEERYLLVDSALEKRQTSQKGPGRLPRRIYLPTDFGKTIFSLFPIAHP